MAASQEKVKLYLQDLSKLTSDMNMKRKMAEFAVVAFASQMSDGPSSSTAQGEKLLAQGTCKVSKPEVTFGGDAVSNELINHLLNEDCKKWVGLWGMGGIGKMFTASTVYHDPNIQRYFSGGTFWLTVSKDQASPIHLFKQLLEKLEGHESISRLPNSLEMAKAYVTSLLDRDRVLLVLDDVWQQGVLNYLDVLSEANGCVILLTTRDQGILRPVIDVVKIFEVPRLSIDDSWQLFSWHAFHIRGRMVPQGLEAIAKEVANECQGLPLALEVIGSAMADKKLLPCEVALGRTILQEWEACWSS